MECWLKEELADPHQDLLLHLPDPALPASATRHTKEETEAPRQLAETFRPQTQALEAEEPALLALEETQAELPPEQEPLLEGETGPPERHTDRTLTETPAQTRPEAEEARLGTHLPLNPEEQAAQAS